MNYEKDGAISLEEIIALGEQIIDEHRAAFEELAK